LRRASSPIAAAAAAASTAWFRLRRSPHGRDPGEAAFVLWCHRNAFAPRPAPAVVDAAANGTGAARPAALPELRDTLFTQQFGAVRIADGHGSAAVLGRSGANGHPAMTGVALLVRGDVRQPGLRVHATRGFAGAVVAPPPDPAATPSLLAGRYVVDGDPDAVPDELVVELLDPTLPPLVIECLPRGLLVGTATSHLQVAQIDVLAAVTARLRLLLLEDVATATRRR